MGADLRPYENSAAYNLGLTQDALKHFWTKCSQAPRPKPREIMGNLATTQEILRNPGIYADTTSQHSESQQRRKPVDLIVYVSVVR